MTYTVYVIQSIHHDFLYTGMTTNLTRRLKEHNSGYNKSTKPYAPYRIIYTEHANNSIDARRTEKYLKGGKGKNWLKKHIL